MRNKTQINESRRMRSIDSDSNLEEKHYCSIVIKKWEIIKKEEEKRENADIVIKGVKSPSVNEICKQSQKEV